MKVFDLQTEYKTNPLGIDVTKPRFSWKLESERRAQAQTAYRILIATDPLMFEQPSRLAWDSGRMVSDRSVHVEYEGSSLLSNTLYYWKVQAWDAEGEASAWSEPAMFSTGLFRSEEWLAKWIGLKRPELQRIETDLDFQGRELSPCPCLRRTFTLRRPAARATVFASALGLYSLRINGQQIGEDVFAPGWTDYHIRVQYQTYDATSLLLAGDNAVSALLGSGWYAGHVASIGKHQYGTEPYLLFQMIVEYDDGSLECFISDESWKGNVGPYLDADIIMGEIYDARRVRTGWERADYDDAEWSPVAVKEHTAKLAAQVDPPVRIQEELVPKARLMRSSSQAIYDMGQNIAGWVRIVLTGPRGSRVRLRYGERLDESGSLYTANLRGALQTDEYILSGEEAETYAPRFTYHGFQYAEVTTSCEDTTIHSIVGQVVHSSLKRTGTLTTSNELVNRLQSNIVWGGRDNFLSVPTDCPQRDERWGWTGDAQVFVRTAAYNMDIASFFRKYMIDMVDAQQASGNFHIVNPEGGLTRYLASLNDPYNLNHAPGWGDAGVILPWTLFQIYGDRRILQEHYEAYRRWIQFVLGVSENYIIGECGFGDWLSIGADTPKDVGGTAYFAYSASTMACIAAELGKDEDAREYEALFDNIREAFNRAFVAEDGRIKGHTQTGYVLALRMKLLSAEKELLAVRYLVEDIEKRDWHLSTGFLGVSQLLPVLSEGGRTDVAYRLLLQDTFPSWGYSIKQGATTIWERWDGWTEERGFQDPGMNSLNHYSLGSVGEWLYRTLAGIDYDREQPGFRKIIIRPDPGGGLTFARGEFECVHGTIVSHWSHSVGRYRLRVVIPVNTTATVYVKTQIGQEYSITMNGAQAVISPDAQFAGVEGDEAIFRVGSGEYTFESIYV